MQTLWGEKILIAQRSLEDVGIGSNVSAELKIVIIARGRSGEVGRMRLDEERMGM